MTIVTMVRGQGKHGSPAAPGRWRDADAGRVGRLLAALVSVSLHGVWMYGSSFGTPRAEPPPPIERVELAWIETMNDDASREASRLRALPSPPPVAHAERVLDPPARKRTFRTKVEPVAAREKPQPTSGLPAPALSGTIAPSTSERPDARETLPADALSPRRVAAALFFSNALIDSPTSIAAVESDQEKAERVSRQLNAELGAAAAELRHLSKRPPPKLEHMPDGSYRWKGHLFTAQVAPDGMVSFDDAPDFSVDGFGIGPFVIGRDPRRGRPMPDPSPSSYLREMLDYLPILKLFGHFDLEAALARAYRSDPHVAERLWFLQQTETLRLQLSDAAAASPRQPDGRPRR